MAILHTFVFILIGLFGTVHAARVEVGLDRLFKSSFKEKLKDKTIGLITNQSGVNSQLVSAIDLFIANQTTYKYKLKALFAPEHGLFGEAYAGEKIATKISHDGLPIYSLHGETRRPTKEMLKGIDLLIFDIQDIGCRSYTFASTLYYAMEEAAKHKIQVMVLDRPNPLGGLIVDGPMLEEKYRSFLGYIDVAYCHGMTIGELATFFNEEYKIGCNLVVVPMQGWRREMNFADTGLFWIPTSPNIPTGDSPFFYPTTGLLGEFGSISIGIGYTLPFKLVAAPWIKRRPLVRTLNQAMFNGVKFVPTLVRPFFGSLSGKTCEGALIFITDKKRFLPVTTQYLLMTTLKKLYVKEFTKTIKGASSQQKELFLKVCGTDKIYKLLLKPDSTLEEFKSIHKEERDQFLITRKKYLMSEYR